MGIGQSSSARSGDRLKCNLCEGQKPPEVENFVSPPTFHKDAHDNSVIQFSCAIYYALESEGQMLVDVVRLGSSAGVAHVSYHTQDSSAKAGVKYTAVSGLLVFEEGDMSHQVTIPIIEDEAWDAALEFTVELCDCKGAQLGKYLHTCRVKIIDDDTFPTNKFRHQIQAGEYEEIDGISLLIEYAKMNMRHPLVRWGCYKMLLLDQMKNLYFIMTVYLIMYLTDVLAMSAEGEGEGEEGAERRLLYPMISAAVRMLGEGEMEGEEEEHEDVSLLVPGSRRYTAMVVGILYILPYPLMQLIDNHKEYYGVSGHSRRTLQANLLRKFLNYKEENRSKISSGEITMAMVRDVIEVVQCGFMKILVVITVISKFAMIMIFVLKENKNAVIPLAFYPLIMIVFLRCREKITIATNEESAKMQNIIARTVQDTVKSFSLISDFLLRPYIVDTYEKNITEFNEAMVNQLVVSTNNSYLAPWIMTLLIGGYIIVDAPQVSNFGGTLSIGTFLATINIFKEVGKEFAEIYMEINEIQNSTGPLKVLTRYMNYETDLEQRRLMNRARRELGKSKREEAKARDDGDMFAVDKVQIELIDVSFTYKSSAVDGDTATTVVKNLNTSFRQGALYAILGQARGGKATLLRLLGQVLLPNDGHGQGIVFMPPHLRVLHLTSGNFVLDQSLLKNIVFHWKPETYGGLARVKKICEEVGFSQYMLNELMKGEVQEKAGAQAAAPKHQASSVEIEMQEADSRQRSWVAKLSHTDYARINLARAFIMNPECMVLHKPCLAFDDDECKVMMRLMRRHVDQRGVDLPEAGRRTRRPRTVFFTTQHPVCATFADKVFEVSYERGIREVKKANVNRLTAAGMDTKQRSALFDDYDSWRR